MPQKEEDELEDDKMQHEQVGESQPALCELDAVHYCLLYLSITVPT